MEPVSASRREGGVEKAPAARSGAAAARTGRRRGFRFPLSALILRYFAYVLAGAAALALSFWIALGLLLGSGLVVPANYGDAVLDETTAAIAGAGRIGDDMVPSCYRWARIAADGDFLEGDMPEDRLDAARAAAFDGLAVEYSTLATTRYETVPLSDGSAAVLMYEYLPQFASKALRDALPNPQNLLFALFGALAVAMVAGVAARASRVLQRKMRPLARAAARIEARDLDFSVDGSNVREVDEVLEAMERMRASLQASLEAQWRAEQRQRDQVAALAHDLKTPLTIVRGNVDMLLEEDLGDEARACAADAAAGADQLERTLASLVEVSRGPSQDGGPDARARIEAGPFADRMRRQAGALAAAAGVGLSYGQGALPQDVPADERLLERAVMNLVSNAVEHAPAGTAVGLSFGLEGPAAPAPADRLPSAGSKEGAACETGAGAVCAAAGSVLAIAVRDEGTGFSPEALAHGAERFWRGDAAHASDGHSGLGLFIAASAAEQHGGTLEVANRTDGPGACATLRIPLG